MNPERWQKVKAIIEKAVEIIPAERSKFLREVCGEDAELLTEVQSLLDFEHLADGVFDRTASEFILEDSAHDRAQLIGKQIEHYKIISELGVGGMGAVYLAERADGEFEQKVALKLIKRGMDSDAVLRRFINERQILASLEHPGIARLVDGGTTQDGLPYFVMEYVEGVSILEYTDEKNLDFNERLDLFREVCRTISFAHQNLIIHRDLKPSNILIAKDGTVKLLDFGIAKLLKSGAENQTATQMHVFTPEYASPEQMRGEKLTTATDVYSLGVILYELLTGERPYKTGSKNIGEIIKVVCETESARPSSVVLRSSLVDLDGTVENKERETKSEGQLTKDEGRRINPKSLRGDLDNIILKALRKEPERRYSSVEQLEEDIRRHQNGLPVTASADTWSYRASKFVQRNRIGVAAAALILITLLGGLFSTLYQRNRAQRRFNDVRQLANSFLFEFHDAIENLPGSTAARELVVKRAVEYLDKLAAESENDPALQRELGMAYERIGKIQGNSYYSNLGDTDGAMKSYLRSLEIRQKLADGDSKNLDLQYDLARSHRGVGDMLYTVNDLHGGLQSYEKGAAILEKIVAVEQDNSLYLNLFADVLSRLGDIKGMEGFANLGDTRGALESYRRVVEVNKKLVEKEPENKEYAGDYATRLIYLGKLQSATGNAQEAIASGQKSVAIFEKLIAAEPNHTGFEIRLLLASNVLLSALLDEGREAEAVDKGRQLVERLKKLVATDPKNVQIKRSLSVVYNSFGLALFQAKDYKGALENYHRSLEIAEELSAADPKNGENKRDVLINRQHLSEAQIELGENDAAISNLKQNISRLEEILKADDADKRVKSDLAECFALIGKASAAKGDRANAAEYYRRFLPLAEEFLQENSGSIRVKSRLAAHLFEAGKFFADFAQSEKSEKFKTESCDYMHRSFAVWNEMKQNGTLNAVNAIRFDEAVRQSDECR